MYIEKIKKREKMRNMKGTREELQNNVGTKVRTFRKQMGITIEELAHRAGVSISFIGQIERGHKVASLNTMNKIANALDVDLTDIIVKETDEEANRDRILMKIEKLVRDLDQYERKWIYHILKSVLTKPEEEEEDLY